LTYRSKEDNDQRVIMIHRVILGSLERFMATLIEHFAGAFPVWLASVQLEIIPVSDDQVDFALKIKEELKEAGIRVEINDSQEKLGYKIRQSQVQQVPYMIIIGDKEIKDNTISVRDRREGDIGSFKLDEFKERILKEIEEKSY